MKKILETLRVFLRSDYALICLLVICWHLVLLIVGEIAEGILPFAIHIPAPEGLLSHTWRWDSGWYTSIIQEAYSSRPGQAAFYPLFPLLTYVVHVLSFKSLSVIASGLLLNIITSCLAAIGLYKITLHHLAERRIAWTAVILFLSFPTSVFMHFFYTEALFCALGFWAYYFALKQKWWAMALCLAFLSATRITALLFIGLCGLEYLRSINYNLKRINRQILWFFFTPVGFFVYALYLKLQRGSYISMFHAYDEVPDWQYQVFNPNFIETYTNEFIRASDIIRGNLPLDEISFANTIMPVTALLLLALISIWGLLKLRTWTIPLSVFGLLSFIFFTLNSNVVSAHRYVLPVLTIYLIPLAIIKRYPMVLPVVWAGSALVAMTQVVLLMFFVTWRFAG